MDAIRSTVRKPGELPACRGARAGFAAASIAVYSGVFFWLYYVPTPKLLWGDEVFYVEAARRLVAGQLEWRLEPLWPSLYPQLIAGFMVLSPDHFVLLIQLFQLALLMIAAAVLRDLVEHVSGSATAGMAAFFVMAVCPELVGFAGYLWPELVHLFLMLAALWLMIFRGQRIVWCVIGGMLLGLAIQTKSVLLPVIPVLVVVWMVKNPSSASNMVLRAGALVLALAATIGPTVCGNVERYGMLAISDSSSFNVWVGLRDVSRRNFESPVVMDSYQQFLASGESFVERNRWVREQLREVVRQRGVLAIVRAQLGRQYFRLFDKDSFVTSQLPGGPVAKLGRGYLDRSERAVHVIRGWSYLWYVMVMVSAPFGFIMLRHRYPGWVAFMLAYLGYVLALCLVVHVKTRYRIQIFPVLFYGTGCAVAWLQARLRGADQSAASLGKVAASVGLALTALFLMFAGPYL